MGGLKVLYISQEVTPYLPSNERADQCRYLPQAIQEKGNEIRIFMPKFGLVNERRNQLHEVIRLSGMNIILDDTDHPLIIKVASIQQARMQVYFIDNDDFFSRKAIVADADGVEFKDNEERIIFFMRGVLETVKKLRWMPDVIHCHGWFAAVAPLFIKRTYSTDPFFKNTKVVYSVYNDDYKTPFSPKFATMLKDDNVSDEDLSLIANKEVSFTDLMRFALSYSDGVIEGSAELNPEVKAMAEAFGERYLPYQGAEYVDPYMEMYQKVAAKADK